MPCFPSLVGPARRARRGRRRDPGRGRARQSSRQAGALGCGGAVVFAAGFREGRRRSRSSKHELRGAALRHALPVCGPNCDGLIALHARAALWGDALVPQEPGHVALVSQSGNLAVNALATRRGLRLHTAISSGNEAVLTTPDYLEHLAAEPEVRSVALLIEDDGDGARLCDALRGVRGRRRRGRGAEGRRVRGGRGRGRRAHGRGGRRPPHLPRARRGGRRGVGDRPARAARAREGARRPRRPAARPRPGHPHLLGRRLGPRRRRGRAARRPPARLRPGDRGRPARARPGRPRRSPTRSTTRR